MSRTLFDQAFKAAHELHLGISDLSEFVDWDPMARFVETQPWPQLATDALASDQRLRTVDQLPECKPLADIGRYAKWLRSYTDCELFPGFNARFGSYSLIGTNGHFRSEKLASFVVYSDSDLWYPWHHHPAEEMYLVLAGEAEFHVDGEPVRICRPGDTVRHASNQTHALRTLETPVMAYVVWRGDLMTKPILTL